MKKIDLGAVSAYALAVERGYQGTEDEFAMLLVNAANYATAAAESATEAEASATEAEASATEAEASATEAAESATAAAASATAAAASATAAAESATEAEASATAAAESATAAAESATAAAASAAEARISKTQIAEYYFTLNSTALEFGVKWPVFSVSPISEGTRTRNATNMVAYPSTALEAKQNDFDKYTIFNGLTVNGYVDNDGEFVVTYFESESGFSRSDNDTWILFGTHWFRYDFSDGEELIITGLQKEGFAPEPAAIRPDKSIRPFVAIAAYAASEGSDGKPASISGRTTYYNMSHNSCITKARTKGTQYCMTTSQDKSHLDNLFLVAFATRNSQSIMQGCTNYNLQYAVAAEETDVERVLLTNAQANNILVGSYISVGDMTTNTNKDRGQSYMHNVVNRKQITAVEDLGDGTSAIYINNGGVTFSTTATTYISTMPWNTGATDNVLGTCGSPISNTSGKCPYKLFGVECAWGQHEVIGNTVMKIAAGIMKPYICYDCTNLTSSAPTSDYCEIDYELANTSASWKYISELGYDENNPSVRHGIAVEATSNTGYADGQYTENLVSTLNGAREILSGGALYYGSNAGRFYANLHYGLSNAYWYCAARLSATGRCAQSAA